MHEHIWVFRYDFLNCFKEQFFLRGIRHIGFRVKHEGQKFSAQRTQKPGWIVNAPGRYAAPPGKSCQTCCRLRLGQHETMILFLEFDGVLHHQCEKS